MAPTPRARTGQRGAIAALTGILLLTLVGMTVVGVDVGRVAFTATEVQTVAEVGALGYARAMLRNQVAGSAVRNPASDALEVVSGNSIDGQAASASNIASYTTGTWNFTTRSFTAGGTDPNAVEATGVATVENLFAALPVFSSPTSTVTKTATAAVSCPDVAHVFPLAVGDCSLFDPFRSSDDCDDLPELFQQPRDNSCWTTLFDGGGGAGAISNMLPAACCQGGNCGGGQTSPLVGIGTTINLFNGQMNSLMHIMEDCIEHEGLTEFVVPIVECDNGVLNCSGSAEVIGFASLRFTRVVDQGRDKLFDMEFFCNDEAPVQGQGGECLGTETVALVR
jgi:hypothetical protein